MSCKVAVLLCLSFVASMDLAHACDATGMQTCNVDHLAAIQSGSSSCDAIDTMLSCMNAACAGCDASLKQQFNAIVSPMKTTSCGAGTACASSPICTASEPLTCSG